MSTDDFGWADPTDTRRHLWPHGTHVLDLGSDVQAAAHLHDLDAHHYRLCGVRLDEVGGGRLVAYYDGARQSGLTRHQRDMVRAWAHRHLASAEPDVRPRFVGARSARERTAWLAIALLPALLALAFVACGVTLDAHGARGGPVFVSAASVLALVSAIVTWRHASR
ncbi:hypothetical protein tb265_22520 [Gemmatimonadetes bacterium T265]|nr:hypothetical protein tb265_22520 [Gemmatimonadetes bacterium T265]